LFLYIILAFNEKTSVIVERTHATTTLAMTINDTQTFDWSETSHLNWLKREEAPTEDSPRVAQTKKTGDAFAMLKRFRTRSLSKDEEETLRAAEPSKYFEQDSKAAWEWYSSKSPLSFEAYVDAKRGKL